MTNTELFALAARGDRDAYKFLFDIWHIVSVWDDLYDGDKKVSKPALDEMMISALVELPTNPFYVRYYPQLAPTIRTMIINWRVSNAMPTGEVSYVLRGMITDLVSQVAYIMGGMEQAYLVSLSAWKSSVGGETFADYMNVPPVSEEGSAA